MIIQLKETNKPVTKPSEVYKILKTVLKSEDQIDRDKEHLWVFQFDTRNRIKVLELVSLGILNASLVHPREVFTRAVANRCCAILLAHNHPSGETDPSMEDTITTTRLVEAGKILGIKVLDHIIISESGFTSLKEKGLC